MSYHVTSLEIVTYYWCGRPSIILFCGFGKNDGILTYFLQYKQRTTRRNNITMKTIPPMTPPMIYGITDFFSENTVFQNLRSWGYGNEHICPYIHCRLLVIRIYFTQYLTNLWIVHRKQQKAKKLEVYIWYYIPNNQVDIIFQQVTLLYFEVNNFRYVKWFCSQPIPGKSVYQCKVLILDMSSGFVVNLFQVNLFTSARC